MPSGKHEHRQTLHPGYRALLILTDDRFTVPANKSERAAIKQRGAEILTLMFGDRMDEIGELANLALAAKRLETPRISSAVFPIFRKLLQRFEKDEIREFKPLWDPASRHPLQLVLRRRSRKTEAGEDTVGNFVSELDDEWRHLSIMRLVKERKMSKISAIYELIDNGVFNLEETTLNESYKRHTRRAKERGYLYEHEQVLAGILPPSGIDFDDLPRPGRRKRK